MAEIKLSNLDSRQVNCLARTRKIIQPGVETPNKKSMGYIEITFRRE